MEISEKLGSNIIALREKGLAYVRIAQRVGVPTKHVTDYLKAKGIQRPKNVRKRMQVATNQVGSSALSQAILSRSWGISNLEIKTSDPALLDYISIYTQPTQSEGVWYMTMEPHALAYMMPAVALFFDEWTLPHVYYPSYRNRVAGAQGV